MHQTILTKVLVVIFAPTFKILRYFTWWTFWLPLVFLCFTLARTFCRYPYKEDLREHLTWSYNLIRSSKDWPIMMALNFELVCLYSILWVILLPMILVDLVHQIN